VRDVSRLVLRKGKGTELMSNVGAAAVTGPAIQVGTPDLVTGNYIFSPLDFFFSIGVDATVLMSDGHGGLVAAAGSPVLVSLTQGLGINVGVSLGDMNGDGKLDIVAADPNGEVAVFLGDGHGGFTAGAVLSAGLSPWALALGDLNGDGRLDIVTGDEGTNTLSVVLADGLGGYAAAISIPAGIQPFSLALGDVNGDGTVDIIAGNAGSGSVTVALNDGHGGFSTTTVPVAPDPLWVALGDLNGDGHLDLVVAGGMSAGTVDVLLGDGLGGFTRVPGAPFAAGQLPGGVALGDLNGDGLVDIVVANILDSNIIVLFGDGNGGFTAQTPVAIGALPRSVALADVNGDGLVDIVTTNYLGSVSVVLNDGHGGFGAATSTQLNPTSFVEQGASLALGNLDNVQTTAEDTNLVFDAAHDNAIRVSDLGAGGASETLTLTVLHGALTLAAAGNLSIVANAGSSNIQLTGTLADINAALDGLIYRPDQDYNGTDTLTLDLNDNGNNGGAAQSTSVLVPIEITAVNDAPAVSNAIPDQSVAEDTAWSFQFAANAFTDPEGDAITFAATLGSGDPLPAWLSFNAATRTFSGTPPTDFNGPIDLKVTASDGTLSNFDTFTLTVTPVNDAPVLSNAVPDQSVAEDTAWSFQFAANAFTDPDGDALAFTPTLGNGAALPAWLSFDAATRTFSGTPPANFNGAIDLKVTASDGTLSSFDTFTLTVTPVKDAPVLADLTNASYRPHGTPVILSPGLRLSDVDSAALIGATVHIAGGTFAGDGDLLAASVAGTAIAASYDATTETLTLSGADTLAHYQQVLSSVTFESTSANPGDTGAHPARTVTWQVNDGGATDNLSNVETTTIDIGRSLASSFDNNGHGGIVWQNADGTPAVWLLSGTTLNSGANVGFNPGPAWHAIGAGDFNGDGNADLLWQNADGTPAVWLMDGQHLLAGQNVGFNPGPAWHVIGAGDFDGDGKSDILWQNNNGQAAVWLMDGFNLKSGSDVGINPGPSWHAIASADFNGDGKADILWQNTNGQAAVWLMDGRNLISGQNVGFNPGASWHVQGAGDFNGDGKADILWQNADGTPAVWLMNGQSLIAGQNVGFNPGANWQVHATADTNGDGKADIIWQNLDGTPAVWLMDGFNLVTGSNVGFDPGPNWHVVPPHHDTLV
jgi:hypothetical protein